jgi:cysteine desulfurase
VTERRIYLDHAATTPLRPEVLEAMLPWLREATGFGNANALYREGQLARQALEDARECIAAAIGAKPTELIFTSGGTEANNAAIAGITRAVRARKGREKGGNHVLTSAFEHHAVLEPVQALKRDGWKTALVQPQRDGFIHTEDLIAALCDDTTLVSIMAANNEIGSVQPTAELAACAHQRGALFHTDAVQMLGKLPFDVSVLDVDAASFSAHKTGGPKGVGALYLKNSTPFLGSMLGGGQEGGRRSGTQNVAGAVGFACALELAEQEREVESARIAQLRDGLAARLIALDPRITLTLPVATPPLLPNILSILVAGYESESLILALDDQGFAVSGGSACSTGSLEPSHVLMSLGLTRDQAYSVLRISLGHETTAADCDAFIATLAGILRLDPRIRA